MSLPVRVLRRCRAIFESAARERPLAAAVFVPAEIWRLLCGRIAARIAGFAGSVLGPGGRVLGTRHITVGPGSTIKRQAWIEAVERYGTQRFSPQIRIGARLLAFDRLHISAIEQVHIGDDCLFGSGVYIADHNHGVYRGADQSAATEAPIARRLQAGAVHIGARVWLGDNVVVVGPVRIGDGAVVGANSVVTSDVPAGAVAAGAPATTRKQFNFETQVWELIPNQPAR